MSLPHSATTISDAAIHNRVDRLERHVYGDDGDASLENRLRKYVEERAEHKHRNAMEAIDNLADVQLRSEEKMDQRHSTNTTKVDRLTWIVAVGVGIVLTVNVIMTAIMSHLLDLLTATRITH